MTSGTYTFSPSVGETVLNALSRIGVRGPAVMAEHMNQARLEANLMQAEWSNKGPNLWDIELVSVSLTQGTASYSVNANVVMILDAYITTTSGGVSTDRTIGVPPLSRTEYAALPEKAMEAPPTTYWFDRLTSPTIYLWPVPDGNGPYTLNYYCYRQIQDAALTAAGNFEVPYLWLDAAAAGLAHRLSRHYAPALEQIRKADAMEAYQVAADQNAENVPLYVFPALGSYFY